MSQPIITVENLSKAYRIGLKEEIPDTLVGAMTSWARAPLQNWRRLRKLNTFDLSKTAKHKGNGTSVVEKDRPAEEEEDIIWALRDVSFEVKEGEAIGIIGRNGAGKSTLLKILSRITEPTSGRAVIRGRVSSLLEVGTGFHPELTGRENIYMNGTILGMTKKEIDRKFDEIVDFSGVEKFLDTPVKRYSSGMKVRLAFAVAAHLEPEILIVDEVLAVGDGAFRRRCLGKMEAVAGGGRTVVFVSHNMPAIESLCDVAIWIDGGRIVSRGDSAHVVADYERSIVTQAFEATSAHTLSQRCQILRDVQIIGEGEAPTQTLKLCMALRIRFLLAHEGLLRNVVIGVGFNDMRGERALTVHTPLSHDVVGRINGAGVIECEIPYCPLAPGTYTLKVTVSVCGNRVDSIDSICPFEILDGEIGNEGRAFQGGACVARSTWRRIA